MTESTVECWWTQHEAYGALCAAFKGHTRSPRHLAFLTLTGLRAFGWDITPLKASE